MRVSGRTPTVWAVHDGKIGMANQVLGLAEAVGYPVIEKAVALRSPWRHLAPPLWIHPMAALAPEGARLEPPWPDLLIACGRGVTALALAVKRLIHGSLPFIACARHCSTAVEPNPLPSSRDCPGRWSACWLAAAIGSTD